MNLQNKYMVFCAVIFILAPIFLSSLTGKITSTDWTYRHSVWIESYLRGDFTAIFKYPPLFHWMMIILTLGFLIPPIYFQVVFALLSTGGILYYVYRKESEEAVVLVSILLASSIAYVSFAGSLMPQAVDYLLFPIILLFYSENRVKSVIIGILAIFFIHMSGLIFCIILFAHSLLTKRYKFAKITFLLIVLLTPVFYYYYFLAPETWDVKWDWKAQSEWEKQYMNPPYMLFLNSGFLTWILLPFAIYKLYRKRFKLTESQLLYVIWVFAFFSLVIFQDGIWRAISYQIVPLSILVASLISDKNGNRK